MSINDIIKQSRPILNEQVELMLEGRMEDELVAQLGKWYKTKHRTRDLDDTQKDEISSLAKSILDVDPTKKKSWRVKIKDWIISNDIKLPEDSGSLKQELIYHMKTNSQKMDFDKRSDLSEFIANIKKNRGIVDEIFDYKFEIDYSDTRFTIYHIQDKDKAEYLSKLGQCTTWCISTEQMFGYYPLPYYLLVDKKEKKQYAIVPTGGQFRDSKQNTDNSEKRFEEFDKILDLRNRYYYKIAPSDIELIDSYIYEHPSFEKADDKVKLAIVIPKATINSDGTIDVDGDIDITDNMIIDGKFKHKFGKVSGNFKCYFRNLTSLEGSPTEVGGEFICSDNKLTSLEGSPTEVGGEFICSDNKLTSLEGAPLKVDGNFSCMNNHLTNLKGAPTEVKGSFMCSYNNLTSLKGAPSNVGGGFYCGENDVTSLEGGPKEVGSEFICINNKLTSLKGAPKTVGGNFNCKNNPQLKSLDGIGNVSGRIITDID